MNTTRSTRLFVMRSFALAFVFTTLTIMSGCTDGRAKRAASLVNTKLQVAKAEFEAAPTDAEKVQKAKQFFDSAAPLTQTLEDYHLGKTPVPEARPVPQPVSRP